MFYLENVAIAVIFIFFTKIFLRLYKFLKFCVALNKLPGPNIYPLPIFLFERIKKKPEDEQEYFYNTLMKCETGILMTAVSFTEAMVYIRKPHHIQVVLRSTKNITKSYVYDSFNTWLGNGLLTSTGQKWFHQRKIITPAFNFGVVDRFSEIMSEKTKILNQIIEETVKNNPQKPIEFFSLITKYALDVIYETAMGVKMNSLRNFDSEYTNALCKVTDISTKLKYPWLKWDWIFYRTKLGLEYKTALNTLINLTLKMIRKKQQSRKPDSDNFLNNKKDENEFGQRRRKGFLDLLLDVNENNNFPMTESELREQVDTFMFAGHDTTAAAINWTIFNLGNNLDIQEKVHQELHEVFGNSTEPATMKEITELKYLDRVIKETLRLHPPVPIYSRRLTEDIELDGHIIPKGCNLATCIFNLHRDPEVWPEPFKFDPDRFLPVNCQKRHPYAYLPFSAGPRNCIGQKFAIAEEKIVLTALLRKWKVKSVKSEAEMKLIASMTLKPYEGNHMYFIPK